MTDYVRDNKTKRILTMGIAILMVFSLVAGLITDPSYAAFTGKKGSKYTVWDGGQITYGSGNGGYSNSRKCDLDDELGTRYSYCVQPSKASPGTGTVTVDKVVTDDNDTGKWNALSNVVYYSPSYPGYDNNVKNVKDTYYTGNFSKDWGIAHLALSYIYAGRPSDMATWGGTHASDLGEVWTKAKRLGDAMWSPDSAKDDAVPDSFKVFICYMSGVQDMIVGYLEAPGHINMKKASNRTSITNGNACYSIKGAVYTVYDSSGKSVGTLTVKEDGTSNTIDVPEGTYTVKETTAPPGYAKDTSTYTVNVESDETTTFTAKEEPITDLVNLLLTKNPAGYPHDHGEGDATLEGAIFKFSYYDGQYSTAAAAEGSGSATATWHFVTDANGKINGQNPVKADGKTNSAFYKDKDGKICYPLGTYVIQEVTPSTGYLLNNEKLVVHITEDGTDNLHVKTYNESIKGDETIIRGGVKLAKIDNDLDEAYAQGDATLEGAEFTIYNKSRESVMVGGKEIAVDGAALVITTNAEGIATSAQKVLPYGSYLVKETKPSEGYLLNEKWSRAFRIRTDGEMIDLTADKVREAVERGGVQIIKRDKELKKSEALGGANLSGIVMTIKNVSGRDVVVRKDLDNKTDKVNWKELQSKAELFEAGTIKRVKSGEDVGKITVHWNADKKAYTAETLSDDLPYGTYTIRESKTNATYQRTDKTEHMFEVREDRTIYSYDDGNNEAPLTFDDYVYRSDVQGTKIGDGDSKRFSFVPFKIISVTKGESHVVVTDKNGFFSTKDRRAAGDLDEDEDADTARVQNPFDDLLEAKEIKSADLEKRAQQILQGVWFGTGEFGSTAEMNNKFGALPYDSYILEEMPCEANEGYILQKFYFTVDQKSQNGFVDLETITDDVPEIGTTAAVNGENANITPDKQITLIDTIEYKNLVRGQKYVAKGRLVDKKTGEVVKDASGKEITSEKEFTVHFSDGKVKVEFTFDGSLLYGKDTVVFEAVYDAEGHITAKHEDLEDEGQTVTWEKLNPAYEMYKIRTTKAPSKGDKYGFFAQDEVEYEVHIENTGNIALTMDVTDTFMEGVDYFTVPELKSAVFTGQGTWNKQGKDKFVANITLNPKEKATITYTARVKDEAKEYLAAAAKDSDSLDEKGNDTNIVYQKNETDDHDGYWNTASCTNVTYPNPENPDEPGMLEPKEDYAQTPVQKPEIGTTLTAKNGDKAVVEGEKTVLVDTIAYKALDTSKWYVFTGELMVKDTGDPLVENGTPITVTSKPFKPLLKNGKVKVTFEINTKGLAGKELVAFETAYRLDGYKKGDDVEKAPKTIVAEHKDLKDKGQTIKVVKPGTPIEHSPKTGDNVHIALAVALMLLAAEVIYVLLKRRKAAKTDDDDDNEEIVE